MKILFSPTQSLEKCTYTIVKASDQRWRTCHAKTSKHNCFCNFNIVWEFQRGLKKYLLPVGWIQVILEKKLAKKQLNQNKHSKQSKWTFHEHPCYKRIKPLTSLHSYQVTNLIYEHDFYDSWCAKIDKKMIPFQ